MKFTLARRRILFLAILLSFSVLLLVKERGCLTVETIKQKVTLLPAKKPVIKNAFDDNEIIKFGVFAHGIRVGSGKLVYYGRRESGDEALQHVSFDASTFSVKDHEEVYGTVDFSYPVRVNRKVRLFGSDETIVEEYAQDHKSVLVTKVVNRPPAEKQTLSSDKKLGNVLLLIYKLRNDSGLKEGKVYDIALPTQSFKLIVREERKIKVPLGTFESYYIESEPAKYKIWLGTGPQRTPLRIQGVIAAGMVYLSATDISKN